MQLHIKAVKIHDQNSNSKNPLQKKNLLRKVDMVILVSLLLMSVTITAVGQSNNTLHPHCEEKCGNHSIPYPFGIGSDCYRNTDFSIVCKKNEDGDYYPYSGTSYTSRLAVFNFSLQQHQVTMLKHISYECYNNFGPPDQVSHSGLDLSGTPFVISAAHNKFTSIGCYTVAKFDSGNSSYTSGCMAYCWESEMNMTGSCTGVGCCQSSIPQNLHDFGPYFDERNTTDDTWKYNPCSYSFIVDQDWFVFNESYLRGDLFIEKYKAGVPMVLEWVAGNETCLMAQRNMTSYACKATNSRCIDLKPDGYVCNCTDGYEGNPYLEYGCRDIDECERYQPCKGFCMNTDGNFTCTCKEGYSSKDPKYIECTKIYFPEETNVFNLTVKLILGIGIGIITLLTSIFWIYMLREKRKLSQEKEKFFKQNGGLLLYEELKSRRESLVFKIFKKEELEKATNNFDKRLILGRGGQGTVYKGTLDNNMIVAIKRARTIDENQKEGFIKEILIVSQINHNNVVKLLGCCLEVEVPMLVYEYIFNGTLYDFLHNTEIKQSMTLDTRMRIAAEAAEALAYLHSSASPPILHRDVKSSNILLNENYTAKVSDFGASIVVANDKVQLATVIQGTIGYLDPEYMRTYVFTEKSDVYSFGVVLLELLTRKRALHFVGLENEKNLASIFLALLKEGRMVQCLDEQLVNEGQLMEAVHEISELARQCLSMKAEDRPTMKRVADELQRLRRHSDHVFVQLQHSQNESDSLISETHDNSVVIDTTEFSGFGNSRTFNIEYGR